MKLTILGCYSATPRAKVHTTAQVLEIKNQSFLIDCGEGTQRQLRKCSIKFSRIKHIFISHLHGDHVFGLIGFIASMGLLHREKELHIYGPKGIKQLITMQLKLTKSWTTFPLHFHELDSPSPQLVYEDDKVSVETIPLTHRIYTNGYLFKEKEGARKLRVEVAQKYGVDIAFYNNIKQGKDVILDDGRRIANKELTADPPPPKRYAFCSDTAYKPDIVPQINKVDVLYHESTFLEEHLDLCAYTKHSTAKQAATIAKEATVGKLILGHYSSRYKNLEAFRDEAQTIFKQVELAQDGRIFKW